MHVLCVSLVCVCVSENGHNRAALASGMVQGHGHGRQESQNSSNVGKSELLGRVAGRCLGLFGNIVKICQETTLRTAAILVTKLGVGFSSHSWALHPSKHALLGHFGGLPCTLVPWRAAA